MGAWLPRAFREGPLPMHAPRRLPRQPASMVGGLRGAGLRSAGEQILLQREPNPASFFMLVLPIPLGSKTD